MLKSILPTSFRSLSSSSSLPVRALSSTSTTFARPPPPSSNSHLTPSEAASNAETDDYHEQLSPAKLASTTPASVPLAHIQSPVTYWLPHACSFRTHADANKLPLDTDDFDMLVCAACVTPDARVQIIMKIWVGVEGSGVTMMSKEGVAVGRTFGQKEDEEGTEIGKDEAGERREKRKAKGEDAEEPVAEKAREEGVHPESSTSSFDGEATSSDPPSASASTQGSTVDRLVQLHLLRRAD
ncbi:hypothetical protein P7C70_g3453, partial [Phenoliferia sp. Uapishka_3]